jgi:hypothetical protein
MAALRRPLLRRIPGRALLPPPSVRRIRMGTQSQVCPTPHFFLRIRNSFEIIPCTCKKSVSTYFFRITQYIGDTHNAHALIPINTRT